MIALPSRVSVEEYARMKGLHVVTVRNQCRAGETVKARRVGRSWEIDIAATDRLQSIKGGNALERTLAIKRGTM